MNIQLKTFFYVLVLFPLLSYAPLSATYFFTGDTVSTTASVNSTAISSFTTSDNTVDGSSTLNPLNSANGAYFNTFSQGFNWSFGVPNSAVPETNWTGNSDQSLFVAATTLGNQLLINSFQTQLSGLAWAQNPGNPGYITGITYQGLQSGGNGSASNITASVNPHMVNLAGTITLPVAAKAQLNFNVTTAVPTLSLPSMVGNTVGGYLTSTISPSNRFNNTLLPSFQPVQGNTATAEFSAPATAQSTGSQLVAQLDTQVNLDSNIIDIIWSNSFCSLGCWVYDSTLTLTNVLSAANIALGYQITGISLLAGSLVSGMVFTPTISGGDVTLAFSGLSSSASYFGQTYEALFQINGIQVAQVPEPSTYLLLASLLVVGVLVRRTKTSRPPR